MRWAQELEAVEVTLRDLPDDMVFIQITSWYPGHTAGGGLVATNPLTSWRQEYAIPLPLNVDGSYEAELYVVWIVV